MPPRDDARRSTAMGQAPNGVQGRWINDAPDDRGAPAPQPQSWPDEDWDDQDAPGGGGWRLLFILILLTGLAGGGWWTTRRALEQGWIDQFNRAYGDVSLLPSSVARPSDPTLEIQVFDVAPGGRALERRACKLQRVPANDSEMVGLVCQALTVTPNAEPQKDGQPARVAIRGAYVLDGIVWIDLDKNFLQAKEPSPLGERLAIYSVVDTFLLNAPSLQGARVLIDGQPVTTAWGWMDLGSPLGVNLSLAG